MVKKRLIKGFVALYALTTIGCATPSKPNTTIFQSQLDEASIESVLLQYHSNSSVNHELAARALVSKFAAYNPLIALELGKLPELQDGISQEETKALEEMVNLYEQVPQKFDSAFRHMYMEGKPNIRKFCSPLQAMFWLAIDGRMKDARDVIEDYTLDKLLDYAWDFKTPESYFISFPEIQKVISGITDNGLKREYERLVKNGSGRGEIQRLLLMDLRRNKRKFSEDARNLIHKYKNKSMENPRWINYENAIDRLNSPKLMLFWFNKEWSYEYYLDSMKSKKSLYHSKSSNCYDFAKFISFLLNKSGFPAQTHNVEDGNFTHTITSFKNGDLIYIIDNNMIGSNKLFLGPFKSLHQIPYTFQSY